MNTARELATVFCATHPRLADTIRIMHFTQMNRGLAYDDAVRRVALALFQRLSVKRPNLSILAVDRMIRLILDEEM